MRDKGRLSQTETEEEEEEEEDVKKKGKKKSAATTARSAGGGESAAKKRGKKESAAAASTTAADDDSKKKTKKNKSGKKSADVPVKDLVSALLPVPQEVLDMPVDPNEPTYCICQQVSYGEMIGCDNPDCPIEWYHFGCIGLTAKPKGKWYCSKCTPLFKKKK